jgi:peroxiredoxin Q/BCP
MKPSTFAKLFAGSVRELFRKKGDMKMLSPGDPAPDFDVRDHRGRRARLSDQRGRTIVLWFYPKADTPG